MKFRKGERGFALPTMVLASLLVMMVLGVALSTISGVRAALDEQYYSQLVREASEAGIRYAEACYALTSTGTDTTKWPKATSGQGATLDTGDDCNGIPLSTTTGCGTSAATAGCYVVNTPSVDTSFSVSVANVQGAVYTLSSVGKVMIVNQSGAVTRTVSSTLKYNTSIRLVNIASGNDTTCIAQNGLLYCWGDNSYGQVGDGGGQPWGNIREYNTTYPPNNPHPFPYLVKTGALNGLYVQAVATGMYHTCAIANSTASITNNAVYCWGSSALGQAGVVNYDGIYYPTIVPIANNSSLYNYTQISARNNTCVMGTLKTDLTVSREICWGENTEDESGDTRWRASGGDMPLADLPGVKLNAIEIQREDVASTLYRVKDIASISDDFGCNIDSSDGTGVPGVWCWGTNGSGQYGIGTSTRPSGAFTCSGCSASYRNARASKAITTTGMTNPTMVVTNNLKVCAVNNGGPSGDLFCWGNNEYASGSTGSDYSLSSATIQSTTAGGLMYYNGQAIGTRLPKIVSTPVKMVQGGVTDVAMADHATCYLKAGSVYCFGHNAFGQLGTGNNYIYPCQSGVNAGCPTLTAEVDTELQNQPETYYAANTRPSTSAYQVQGALAGKTVLKIAGGNRHFCAVTDRDETYCWGDNSQGQLGDGTTTPRYAPTRVLIPPSVLY